MCLVLAILLLAVACSRGASGLPESLYGTWRGGNDAVSSVRFSSGGRVELNGGSCAGEYTLTAVDGETGSVHSGYIDCVPVMNGQFTATVTVKGNTMIVEGAVINGSYRRA
jgi:hypothetical protein